MLLIKAQSIITEMRLDNERKGCREHEVAHWRREVAEVRSYTV
jgi:hypothetical protein